MANNENWKDVANKKRKLIYNGKTTKNPGAINNVIAVDVVAQDFEKDIQLWPDLKVAVNKPSEIDAVHYDGKNIEDIKRWCEKVGAKLTQKEDGSYEFLIWGNTPSPLAPGQWLIDYHDKTFGLIADKDFTNTYINDGSTKFHKQQTATTLLLEVDQFKDGISEETAKKLDQWAGVITEEEAAMYAAKGIHVKAGDRKWKIETCTWKEKDANGNEVEKSGPGISVLSKESWQPIPFGQGNHIMKDTLGGIYPQTKASLTKRYNTYDYKDIMLVPRISEKEVESFINHIKESR